MHWLKPVLISWSAPFRARAGMVRERALRVAGGGVWLAGGVLAAVAIWGWIDPFGLRQRLDSMVADQFLQRRAAPPFLAADIMQISIDDLAAEQLGTTDRRHRLARALRELKRLGARAVLVDILFLEKGSPNPFDQEEAIYDGVPPEPDFTLPPELKSRYTDEQLLADALASLGRVVIPFHLNPRLALPAADERAIQQLSRRLMEQPATDARALAGAAGLPEELTARLYEPALRWAAGEIALDPERAAARLKIEPQESRFAELIRSSRDRLDTLEGVRTHSSFDAGAGKSLPLIADIQVPRSNFARSARLGFLDSALTPELDADLGSDEVLRRLPLVARWQDRAVVHQAVAVAAQFLGTAPPQFVLDRGNRLVLDRDHVVPLDRRGRLVINWPMNDRNDWTRVVPQVSLADLLELSRFDGDLQRARHNRRLKVATVDQVAQLQTGAVKNYQSILEAYARGDLEDAARYEKTFDEKVSPFVLDQAAVRTLIERVKSEPPDEAPREDAANEPPEKILLRLVRDVLDINDTLPRHQQDQDDAARRLRERIEGKLCLVGETATGSTDFKITPVGKMPGISVIAAAINTILTGDYPRVCAYPVSALAMLVIAAGLAVPFLRWRPLAAGAGASAGAVLTIYGSFGLVAAANTALSPVTPVAGIVALYLASTTYQWLSEYRQRKLVRSIFEAQTNPTIVERLIEAGQAGVAEVLTPKNRQVTVFFAEIADYEELAGQVAPERLPEILARVFGTMNKLVQAREGTLDRYQGHAMVAFFGAPVYQSDHAQRACRAALECCDALDAMEAFWKERGLPAPRVQVGLHTGELLVGNITLTSRVDYTVAGENLNVAYRIGELNETYGTQIMMSEATLVRCENMVEARELDLVRIKGRREPIRAHELMTAKGRLTPDQLQLRGTFSTGLVAFRNKDYAGALAMFRTCRETAPGDRPVTVYIERCEKELKQTMLEAASNSEALTVLPTESLTSSNKRSLD